MRKFARNVRQQTVNKIAACYQNSLDPVTFQEVAHKVRPIVLLILKQARQRIQVWRNRLEVPGTIPNGLCEYKCCDHNHFMA